MEKCQKVQLSFKGVVWPQAGRGYVGSIGNVLKEIHATYKQNPKQKHFRYVQITFYLIVMF